MKSRSSRPKSDSRIKPEHVAQFLQDGAIVSLSSAEELAASELLDELGLVAIQTKEWVKCANPEDRDFPPRNRHCRGRIVIQDSDPKGNLNCPECDRPVYPDHFGKKRFRESRTQVLRENILDYLVGLLGASCTTAGTGVFRVEAEGRDVTVCVIDYAEEKYLARDRAAQVLTCFIVVNPRDLDDRFLREDWVRRVTLAELVCESVRLPDFIRQIVTDGLPAQILQASLPVCEKGPTSAIVAPARPSNPKRQYVVEVGPNIVLVDGLRVVAKQAGPRFILFRVLWQCYLDDLKSGLVPDEFSARPVRYLTQELEAQTGKPVEDDLTVRRAINRLQTDIEAAVKKQSGAPIGREDIVQTCRKSGQTDDDYGYRLNPFTVVVRPYQADLSLKL